jgi:hypothetical protein
MVLAEEVGSMQPVLGRPLPAVVAACSSVLLAFLGVIALFPFLGSPRLCAAAAAAAGIEVVDLGIL